MTKEFTFLIESAFFIASFGVAATLIQMLVKLLCNFQNDKRLFAAVDFSLMIITFIWLVVATTIRFGHTG